ncbi:MAG: hypothetical protein ACYC91_19640 [Solirubrobacteraceae bacterium]
MLTQENDVEIHALAARGWNQSAISRHTGRDRKTVRKYLTAGEGPVVRERAVSCLEPWRAYIAARFVDDPHLPAVGLLDELASAGFDRSYPTLVRELRRTALRPVCRSGAAGRRRRRSITRRGRRSGGTGSTCLCVATSGEKLMAASEEIRGRQWGELDGH